MAGMNYNIPTVLSADELIEKTFHRAAKISKTGSDALDTKKKTILAKITASGDIVSLPGRICQEIPENGEGNVFRTHDLIIASISTKKSLGQLNWASNRVEKLKNESLREVRRTKDPKILDSIKSSFYGRLSSYINQISKDLLFLQDAKNKFRNLPAVDPQVPTLVVAGFPNVGKSKLVTVLSTAAPQIAPYPFTTKGIVVGHIEDDWRKFQIIDTPGLLDRSFEDRNDIEKQAVLAQILRDQLSVGSFRTLRYSMEKQTELLHRSATASKRTIIVAGARQIMRRSRTSISRQRPVTEWMSSGSFS